MRRPLVWTVACLVLQASCTAAAKEERLRRKRVIYKVPDHVINEGTTTAKDVATLQHEDAWLPFEDEAMFRFLGDTFSFSMSMSMPSAGGDREEMIAQKCGMTAQERSTSIQSVLSSVSDPLLLTDPSTPQYDARVWLDDVDDGILCLDDNEARLIQRYVVALVYFQMNGPNWDACRAAKDGGGCSGPGTRWLDADNECFWFGLGCEDANNAGSADNYFELSLIELPQNGLAGDLPLELFELDSITVFTMDGNRRITGPIPRAIASWTKLEVIDIDDNDMTSTIPSEIYSLTNLQALDLNANSFVGGLSSAIASLGKLRVLQLENNELEGPVPTASLLQLEELVALTLEKNMLTGSVEPICDVLDERRETNPVYLRFFHVDCRGNSPPVECSCCRCF